MLDSEAVVQNCLLKRCSCEFCEIFKNTFFTKHLWTTASVIRFWMRFFLNALLSLLPCNRIFLNQVVMNKTPVTLSLSSQVTAYHSKFPHTSLPLPVSLHTSSLALSQFPLPYNNFSGCSIITLPFTDRFWPWPFTTWLYIYGAVLQLCLLW